MIATADHSIRDILNKAISGERLSTAEAIRLLQSHDLAAIGSAALSLVLKLFWPALPFLDRVGLVFLLCLAIAVVVSLAENKGRHENAVDLSDVEFKTSASFNWAAAAVSLVLVALYAIWW